MLQQQASEAQWWQTAGAVVAVSNADGRNPRPPAIVEDYLKRTLHTVDRNTGEVVSTSASDNSRRLAQGYGVWRRIGLFRDAQRVFTALFTDSRTLWFRFGGAEFDCLAKLPRVSRVAIAPGVKRFTFSIPGGRGLDVQYFWLDWREWPDNGDFLSHVERTTSSAANMWFTVLARDAVQKGADLAKPGVADDLRR